MIGKRPVLTGLVFTALLALVPSAFGQQADLESLSTRLPKAAIDAALRPSRRFTEKSTFDRYKKLSPALARLADRASTKGFVSTSENTDVMGLPVRGGNVAVVLIPEGKGALADLRGHVREMGGSVEVEYDGALFVSIPVGKLATLQDADSLRYARTQQQYRPFVSSGPVNDGVAALEVDALHRTGITGKGVKVGVLDFGFGRYEEVQGRGALPKPAAVKDFGGDRREVHGTACAEIIHSVAPDASLYLAGVSGHDANIIQAAKWLVDQGVDVISFSGGGHGRVDGEQALDRLVDAQTRESGVLWVVAAGNSGDEHWVGDIVDADGNDRVDVPGTDGADVLLVEAGGPFTLFAYWDDWGPDPQLPGATQDLDMYLLEMDPRTQELTLVGGSENPQQGRGEPIEMISHAPDRTPTTYLVVLKPVNSTRRHRVHVTIRQGHARMHPTVAEGSIASPASARQAMAVGAVDVRDGQLEAFSSQGPTDDKRVKPDVVAPDHNLSWAYSEEAARPGRFPGTSAACPHVAGFAALLEQANVARDVAGLQAALRQYSRPMGRGRPNNQFGHGHVDGSTVAVAADSGSGTGDGVPPPDGDAGDDAGGGQAPPSHDPAIDQLLDLLGDPRGDGTE